MGNGAYGGAISNGGALLFSTSANQTLSGSISGDGVLTQSGVGTLKLSGNNSYTGKTIIKGVLWVSSNTALGDVNSGWVEVYSGAALELDNVSIGNKELYLTIDNIIAPSPALRSVNGTNTYGGDIFLSGAAIISADSGTTLILSNPVYGLSNQYSSCDLTVSGNGRVIFQGPIGNIESFPLQDLTTISLDSFTGEAGTILFLNGGSVTTTGPQTYNDIVTLGANTTLKGSGITFDATVQSDGTHNYSLTVWDPGVTIFNGSIGGTTSGTELSSLETFGTDPVLYGSVATTGAQIYHDIVTLGSDIILTGKNITFDSTVKSDVTSDTNFSLKVVDSGSTVFGGAVGGNGTVAGEKLSSLNISSVGDTSLKGIQTTGPISVVASTGNLTVDGNISTLDTSAKAIQLNAGQDFAAGTATGGNIIINSGTISVGTGGIATLYTGSVLNSTGLTNLIGSGSGNFRYNSNKDKANYTKALNSGLNAIYRESPSVEVALANESIQSITGVQNNDPVTNLAGLIALGYSNPTVTFIVPDVHVTTKVYDSLPNTLDRSDENGNEVVIHEETGNETTGNEVAGNNEVSTPAASGVTSGIGPLTHVAVPSLAQAGPTNTFSGGAIIPAVPNIRPEGISESVPRDVNNNEPDKYSDLVQKVLMTGGAVIILGSGSLLLGKKYTISQVNFGKHANVYAHLDHGHQHLNSDVLPKELERKREVSVRIHLDMGIQEVQVSGGSLVNSD